MARFLTAALVVLFCLNWHTEAVRAHGGVSIEDDMCVLTAGIYRAHFTGYQPSKRGAQEFCEDIPEVSRAIIVLDYIDRKMRELSVDFRIIVDAQSIGNTATYADLGTEDDIQKNTIFYKEAEVYKAGTITVEYDFDTAGQYIGILTGIDDDLGETYISVFPFSVGVTSYATYVPVALGIVAFIGLIYYFSERKKRQDAQRKTA